MANPMMQMLGQSVGKRMPNNPLAMIAEFRKFAQGMTPEKAGAEIEKLLTSGRMTKEQFEEYKKILNLHDDLSIDCIIEHYKIELANWSISNFISECDLKSMIDAFKFFLWD